MRQVELEWEGKTHKVWAEKVRGVLWVHGPMGTLRFQPEQKSYGTEDQGGVKEEIRAPMPGKVRKVLKSEGDKVSSGETVLVMEAMKMEFELKASAEAVIKAVNCKAEDQVDLGQLLVKFDLEEVKA